MAKAKEFKVSSLIIIYEFLLGLTEIILGWGLIFLGEKMVLYYQSLQEGDFLDQRNDLLADVLEKILPYLSTHKMGIALLLLGLGAVKITSSIGLYFKKAWARHLLIVLLVILIPFDLYGLITHPDFFEVGYLLGDILIILYMVEFSPGKYFKELKEQLHK